MALLTAMAYAELGSAFHDAGGGYLWVKTSLPDPNGFLSGWMSWFAHAVACSLYALGFGAYFRWLLETAGVPPIHLGFMTPGEMARGARHASLFAYINFRGASEAGKAGNVVTVGKVVIIGAFIAVGIWVHRAAAGLAGCVRAVPDAGVGRRVRGDGADVHRVRGLRDHRADERGGGEPQTQRARAPSSCRSLIVIPIYLLVAFVAIGAVTPRRGWP